MRVWSRTASMRELKGVVRAQPPKLVASKVLCQAGVSQSQQVAITNQYDVMNRLTNRISANGYQVSFAYSLTDQRTNMTDVSGTTSYSYDNRDRLQLKTVAWNGGPTISLNYHFDANA